MKVRLNQSGELNVLVVPVVLLVLLFLTAASFGIWAYTSRQDYKNNTDQKVATAVEVARKEEGIAKDKAFAEQEKNPLTTYNGPAAFGSLRIDYPKTWSTYVHSTSTQPLDAYFHPRTVPSSQDINSVFALRVQVVEQSYTSVLQQYEDIVKTGTVKAAPYAFPKVPGTIGTRLDGQVRQEKKTNGSMVIVPLRDKTLQVYTESPEHLNDLNTIILPNLTFSP